MRDPHVGSTGVFGYPRNLRRLGVCAGLVALILCIRPTARAQDEPTSPPSAATMDRAASQPAPAPIDLSVVIGELGNEEYTRREAATRTLIARGPAIIPDLQRAFDSTNDLEIRYRLKYILENVVQPTQAVLAVRLDASGLIEPGDLITHANGRRVRSRRELEQRIVNGGGILRVFGPRGPREVGPLSIGALPSTADYVSPRGEVIAEAVRLYATGFAEQAYARLKTLSDETPDNELPAVLRARLAYAAGDAETAFNLLKLQQDVVRPQIDRPVWTTPSGLDLAAPGKAPFAVEWKLFSDGGHDVQFSQEDPDLRVQRVLVPAGRFADALHRASELWWTRYRETLDDERGGRTVAGNQLAVISLMMSRLGLRSECARLIEPRSEILRRSVRGRHKWVRVETDAWLPFVAGDTRGAVDGFFEDAMEVLQQPPRADDANAVIRNPLIAARLAFFLYQPPVDKRVDDAVSVVNRNGHPAQAEYVKWMVQALEERNQDVIRQHLQLFLPKLDDATANRAAQQLALLEWVQPRVDAETLATARQRAVQHADSVGGDSAILTAIDAYLMLAGGKVKEARELLQKSGGNTALASLSQLVEFVWNPPAAAASRDALRLPIAAVKLNADGTRWLVLGRDRRLVIVDAVSGAVDALPPPEPGWFPTPLTWPWINCEPSSGRAWAYGRQRVIEQTPGQQLPLKLSLATEMIPAFDRLLAAHFTRLSEALGGTKQFDGENGEFLRSEVQAGQQFFPDPDLPELAVVRALPQDERIVHFALRGGPHVIVDAERGKAWTSVWIQQRLDLPAPPVFFAQALWRGIHSPDPVAMLMSDQGLIRFDLASETLTRIALPGEQQYPAIVPESQPYERRDPGYFYCARLPADGGKVYRLKLPAMTVEALELVNESLPDEYYLLKPRGLIRTELDEWFRENNMLGLQPFIQSVVETVAKWEDPKAGKP